MTYPVTRWFEIAKYHNKIELSITNLVEITWLYRYPSPTEIMYDQESEFIDHEFGKYIIEMEYGIIDKPNTLGDLMYNTILEWIHQILDILVQTCNITQTYIDKADTWLGILTAASFSIHLAKNRLKGYSTGQLVF